MDENANALCIIRVYKVRIVIMQEEEEIDGRGSQLSEM